MAAVLPLLGIDLGGTKIEIIALDQSGTVLLRERVASPTDYPATLTAIVALINAAEQRLGCTGSVGLGTPGSLSRLNGLLKNSNSTWLNGQPLLQDLEQRLQRKLRIANDADCFTLSEAVDGAAAGARSVFGVILGTGVGGGIVIEGRPLNGPNGITGEWGHNPLPAVSAVDLPLPGCYCGRSGCIETWLSGPGLARDHALHTGTTLDARAIFAQAEQGDAACKASTERYLDRLARSLGLVINILDPEVIVLGGGLSNAGILYTEVPRRWQAYVFSDRVDTRLVRHQHGDSSGVRGAAWLWNPGWSPASCGSAPAGTGDRNTVRFADEGPAARD